MFGETKEVQCSVAKFLGDDVDIAMRIGSAPDYPTSQERVADVVLLIPMTTRTRINDMIEIAGVRFKVIGISPSYDGVGKLASYVVEAAIWE